jgi:hypothetical protein
MYAAGHPPLPSIEVAAFSNFAPRHWQYLRQKKDPTIKARLEIRDDRLEEAELVAFSGLESLRKQLTLLTTPPPGGQGKASFPDFARYDCAACHHDLTTSDRSWRQTRGWKTAPGRPTPPSWPLALLQLGLEAADHDEAEAWFSELRTKLDEFDAAMTEQPFGNLEKAKPIAQAIIKVLNGPIGALECKARAKPGSDDKVVDRATAIAMLRRLADIAANSSPDLESARQMVWACRTIYEELVPEDARSKEVKPLFEHLQKQLGADMTALITPDQKPAPIVDSLARRLNAASEYTPEAFRKDFAQLVAHLPK